MQEKWLIQTKRADFNKIAEKFNISPILARIIRNRDVVEESDIDTYLNGTFEQISSPWLFKGMDKAVDIIKIKIAEQNKIRIISDYDVDGICSAVILKRALQNAGAIVDVVIPHRIEDGYGINNKMIDDAKLAGVDTIITCDNGIAAISQAQYAKELGITMIITDHHQPQFEEVDGAKNYLIPEADAIVNHKQSDCEYPFKELCGAMVAYQFASALYESIGKSKKELEPLLAYGAIATVCDIVDLQDENRIIVKTGLDYLRKTNDIGICALINACKIEQKAIDSFHLGFVIGPCLNASGRLDTAKRAMDLLECNNVEAADKLAVELKNFNEQRKEMTEEGAKRAIEIAEKMSDNVLVIYLENCHESVAGIIAGRVKDHFYKPTIVLTDSEEGLKGSGRSIEEYNMFEELLKVKELFDKFGGHKMAAGISIQKKNLEILRKRLNENCKLTQEDLYLRVMIDMQLPFEYVTLKLIDELQLVGPYGKANSKPVFAERDIKINKIRILGKTGNVLKLEIENTSHCRMTAMVFQRSQEFMAMLRERYGQEEINKAISGNKNNMQFMATYYPQINEYMGNKQIQLVIDRFC